MREIKFRAWDKENKIMEYFFMGDNMTEEFFSDKKYIPLQYTDLHDKAGKEIYEGDVLGYGNPNCNCVVRFGIEEIEDNECYGSNQVSGFYLERIKDKRTSHMDEWRLTKVIGNIYEAK